MAPRLNSPLPPYDVANGENESVATVGSKAFKAENRAENPEIAPCSSGSFGHEPFSFASRLCQSAEGIGHRNARAPVL